MTPRRLRAAAMVLVVAGAGLVALAWSQTWYLLRLTADAVAGVATGVATGGAISSAITGSGDATSGAGAIVVDGQHAAGALLPLGLASLTIVLALALAGPVFRVILGVLDALLGLCVVLVAGWSLSDPVLASVEALAEATGFTSDADAWSDRIADIATTGWPYAAIGAGILMIVTGIAIAVTARKWPATGSKYSRVRLATEGGAPADPASDWDALSEGEDPTAR